MSVYSHRMVLYPIAVMEFSLALLILIVTPDKWVAALWLTVGITIGALCLRFSVELDKQQDKQREPAHEVKPLASALAPQLDRYYRMRIGAYPTGHYVYILCDNDVSGRCKIGRTKHPATRLHRFDVKLPFHPYVLAVIPCRNDVELETELHREYAHKRVNGEWFSLSDDDIKRLLSIYTPHTAGVWQAQHSKQ